MKLLNGYIAKLLDKQIKRGFTLLEILVVISIISILIAFGATSYSTAQKKGRDADRKGDLRAISSALEQYYAVCNNVYPAFSGNVPTIICTSPSIAILPTVPVDAKATPYICSGTCNTSSYQICSNYMEAESPTGYCIRNQQ